MSDVAVIKTDNPNQKHMKTREDWRHLSHDINAAIQTVAAKHGLKTLQVVGTTYSGDFCTFKVAATVLGGLEPEQKAYDQYREMMSSANVELPEREWQFEESGMRFEIYGIKPRGTKIICTNHTNGRRYLFSETAIRLHFSKAVAK